MSRRYPHIVSAALLLMVWIATPILSLVHVVVQQHTYCAEHGRLEDASDSHSARSLLDNAPPKGQGAITRTQLDDSEESAGGHSECAFGDSFTKETLVFGNGLSIAPALLAVPVDNEHPNWARTCSIALLRIAPKNSPPLAA